jgi:hypothetical protein
MNALTPYEKKKNAEHTYLRFYQLSNINKCCVGIGIRITVVI